MTVDANSMRYTIKYNDGRGSYLQVSPYAEGSGAAFENLAAQKIGTIQAASNIFCVVYEENSMYNATGNQC